MREGGVKGGRVRLQGVRAMYVFLIPCASDRYGRGLS